MEFNQLREDYQGEQKRQTEFDSPEAKLANDAKWLIAIAKEQSLRTGEVVSAISLARRKDDDIEALREEIAKQQAVVSTEIDEPSTGVLSPVAALEQTPEKVLTAEQKSALFSTLEARIPTDNNRLHDYEEVQWPTFKRALEAIDPSLLYGIYQMEENGHEIFVRRDYRGGKGFRLDSGSFDSPKGIRNIDYFQAKKIAEQWGTPLMPPFICRQLMNGGKINDSRDRNTWDYLETSTREDTDNPGTPEKPGMASCSGPWWRELVKADFHDENGGFRCSLWIPEAA